MGIKNQIEIALKQAMLAGDKRRVEILKGIKNTILNAEVEARQREAGLSDQQIEKLLIKEVKKRNEAAELYKKAGNPDKAQVELAEKNVIEQFMSNKPMSREDLSQLVDASVEDLGHEVTIKDMGNIISEVRQRAGNGADGAIIAELVKEKIT